MILETPTIDEQPGQQHAIVSLPEHLRACDNVVERLSKDRIRSLLIQMAAEMVRGKNMPSEFVEDWDLPVATSRKMRRRIIEQARASRGQCIEWSGTLRRVYDLLLHGLSD